MPRVAMRSFPTEISRLALAMFATSFALVLFELLLTRLFAVVLFAQLAHLALAPTLMPSSASLLVAQAGSTLQSPQPSLVLQVRSQS